MSKARQSIPGGGDALARGAKSAQFSVPSNYPEEPKVGVCEEQLLDPFGSALDVGVKPEFEITDRRVDYDKPLPPEPEPTCPVVSAKPLGAKVLLWRKPAKVGLIVEADTARELPLECEVVAVSDEETRLQVGDKVLIRKFSGTEITVDGHELTVINVADVLLKL